ncbi:MAG: hypothetical protein FWH14_05090 [Oscillospiraceae bacterium]|nr:hypothetical protein [Oscillospiraceae bacterium]
MFDVVFYQDKNGKEPIKELIYELELAINDTTYTTFSDLWNDPTLLTDDEKKRIDFEVALIGKLIEARETKGSTKKELAEQARIKQSSDNRVAL